MNNLIALSDPESIQLRDMKLNLITKLPIFEKVTKLQFFELDYIWCTSQSGLTYSVKIEKKEVNQETERIKGVPSVSNFEKEECKNEQSIAVVRQFNVREDLFNTWAKSSENENNRSLDEWTGQVSKKSTIREDLLSETGNTFIVESDPSFARESESERYTTLKT